MKHFFAFPYAGAGKNAYDIWKNSFPAGISFHQVSLNSTLLSPDGYCDDMAEAVRRSCAEILSIVSPDDDIYFFGHCMGANVAYETAAALERENGIHIKGLFFSAFTSPDVPITDGICHMSDEDFAAEIHSHNVFPEEFFVNKDILRLFLPKIRADYTLIENYCDYTHQVLDCPIAGFFGKDDDIVVPEETAPWRKYTSKEYMCFYFEGDHYFYYSNQERIISIILELISQFEEKRGD